MAATESDTVTATELATTAATESDTVTATELATMAATESDTVTATELATTAATESDTMAGTGLDTAAATSPDTAAADVAAAGTNVVAYSDAEVGDSPPSMITGMGAVLARTTPTDWYGLIKAKPRAKFPGFLLARMPQQHVRP
jgi:hypothetical protein